MELPDNFRDDFLWGASTASHQVEGGTHNQWSEWETAHAAELAADAPKNFGELPVWPRYAQSASKPENFISGTGVAHYDRYEEDFDLLASFNMNAFRFGIEWARLEPEEGQWDDEAIAHYGKYIDGLLARNIKPILNIWHWTNPVWFEARGGFTKRANIAAFETYVAKVIELYGDKLPIILTLNEANTYTSISFVTGEWPPQVRKPLQAYTVYRNLITAHKRAYRIIKHKHPDTLVGLAPNLMNIRPAWPHHLASTYVTKLMSYVWNWYFLNRVSKEMDFVGVNYYFTDYYHMFKRSREGERKPKTASEERLEDSVSFLQRENPNVPLNDMGVYLEPEGLYEVLVAVDRRYHKPVIVTENGVADELDVYRQWWIEQTIIAMSRAQAMGVDIRGYMHWSLLDNFEWSHGWWPKFGLVAVDREHGMKRTPRPSALWFAGQIARYRALNTK